ncbi:MAG: hypothetical protein N2Z70_06095, partial [Bdellovibrionaceae bacterium]|nr:hypothetical protein [Pseudobdellovibrionaceae bacterium]
MLHDARVVLGLLLAVSPPSWAQMAPLRYRPEPIGARIGDALFSFEWAENRRAQLKLGYRFYNFEKFGEFVRSEADLSLFSYTISA